MGSNAANRAFAGSSVYGLTKLAVAGLEKTAPLDLAARGVTVNISQPGPPDPG